MRRADSSATSGMGPPGGRRPVNRKRIGLRGLPPARGRKGRVMTPKTTTLALAGALLALPTAALAAEADDPPSPARAALHANVGGHLTVKSQMRAWARDERRQDRRRAARRARRQAEAAVSPALEAIAACESGGDPTTDTGNGFYGKYQFTLETWAAVGGHGNPAQASEAEQDRRAAILYEQAGASPWPVCGR
jgi:Transglycosylase-like domain